MPRWLPDGERNAGFRLQRLKDKLGNRSNASSEIELDGAGAWLVGEEGRGVRTIIDMVAHTRLDCVLGATATIRQATAQALHHAAHRRAFGKALVDQPLMRVVLADLAVESEAATVTALRLARAFDDAARGDEAAGAFRRLATAVGKYWVCKRQPTVVGEALECLGGNGYVEESIMPRLFRESPLNGIWEGSGNVICLDVLRAMAREPQALEAFIGELDVGGGGRRAPRRRRGPRPVRAGRRRRHRGPGRGAWSRPWRWRSRAACSCGTGTRRWPRRSCRRGSRATKAWRWAPSLRGSTPERSSSGPAPRSGRALGQRAWPFRGDGMAAGWPVILPGSERSDPCPAS